MPRFLVKFTFTDGGYQAFVTAANPFRAVELAEIDARMMKTGPTMTGELLGFSVIKQ